MANVLAILEQRDGSVKKVSHEVLTAARKLADASGGSVDALLIGPAGTSGDGLGAYGADRVFVVADDRFKFYQAAGFAAAAVERAKAGQYGAIVTSATAQGRELAPRL